MEEAGQDGIYETQAGQGMKPLYLILFVGLVFYKYFCFYFRPT